MKSKQALINIITSTLEFVLQMGISLLITPYIVSSLSVEAYGFISLANTFPNYIQVATAALNAMAGRFVSVELFKGNQEKAGTYYSSVIIGNILISVGVAVLCCIFIPNIQRLINVPNYLVRDVQILLIAVMVNLVIRLCCTLKGIAAYVENKLYLTSLGGMQGICLRAVILVLLFVFFPPKIYYIALASIIETIFVVIWNTYFQRKLMPDLRVRIKSVRGSAVKELLSSGIWGSVSRLGGMLTSGLDLLICNLLVGAVGMGLYSLSHTLPAMVLTFVNIIAGAFSPLITKAYAKGGSQEFLLEVKNSMKMLNLVMGVIIGGIVGLGDVFYKLWLPNENGRTLYILTCLSLLLMAFTSSTGTAHNVFVATNKVKQQSIIILIFGAISTTVLLVLLKMTSLGVFAVAGVSAIVGIIRDYCCILPYTAKVMGCKWYTFHLEALKNVMSVAIVAGIGIALKLIISVQSWFVFAICVVLCGGLGLFANLFVCLTREQRSGILKKVKCIFKKENNG